MADKFLDEIFSSTEEIQYIAFYMQDFADAFRMTGNEEMHRNLRNMAKDLLNAQERIKRAVAKDINDRYKESQASAARTLKMILDSELRKTTDN